MKRINEPTIAKEEIFFIKMPPKSKAAIKEKQQKQEDKTFGLKNKKGAKAQKFVQQVKASSSGPVVSKVRAISHNFLLNF